MYLPSKFIHSKYKIPLVIVSLIFFFALFNNALRFLSLAFLRNLTFSKSDYERTIQELKAKNLALSLKLDTYASLESENERLKNILRFREEKEVEIIPLHVIAFEPSQFRKSVIVDAGKNRGVTKGMVAVDAQGNLMGKVLTVFADYSELVLLSDPEFTITVSCNDAFGLLQGTLGGIVKVFYIEPETRIEKGDIVSTFGGAAKVTLSVGTVERVKYDGNSFFLDITVKPYFEPHNISVVYLIQ